MQKIYLSVVKTSIRHFEKSAAELIFFEKNASYGTFIFLKHIIRV